MKMDEIQKIEYFAEIAQKSGLFPKKSNIFQIKAIIQLGREIGLSPFQALKHIDFVQGKVNMEVQAQLALFHKNGGKSAVLENTAEKAVVQLEWQNKITKSQYTIEEAEAAKLTSKDNWKYYPAIMLKWRAFGNILKFIVPELFMGLYSKDELSDFIKVEDVKVEDTIEQNLVDGEILEMLKKDEKVSEYLEYLQYTRRQAIDVFKDFGGNMDRICQVLENEIKHIKRGNE